MRRVPGSPAFDLDRYGLAGFFASRFDHLHHRVTSPVAEIDVLRIAAGFEKLEREDVRAAEVFDVDVVPDRRPVFRRVVVAKHSDGWNQTLCGSQDIWDEMRLRLMIFAKAARRSGRIEVAKRNKLESVGVVVGAQYAFEKKL